MNTHVDIKLLQRPVFTNKEPITFSWNLKIGDKECSDVVEIPIDTKLGHEDLRDLDLIAYSIIEVCRTIANNCPEN